MKLVILALIVSINSLSAQDNPDKIVGTWYSKAKEGRVLIYEKEGRYFGKLIALKKSMDSLGKPLFDSNNPDASKRTLPLMGIVFLTDFVYTSKDSWKGKLYDYDGANGNTYDSYITINEKGVMNIRGFWGYSWFGLNKGLYLTKVE